MTFREKVLGGKKNQRDKDTDIYKEIECSIDIYVMRLKMNSCLLHLSRHLVTKSEQFNTHQMGCAK